MEGRGKCMGKQERREGVGEKGYGGKGEGMDRRGNSANIVYEG